MSIVPVYDPKAFDGIDLRKYHIRDLKDVMKFNEFVASRMEEAQFVLKKFNTQYATFQAVSAQLQKRVTEEQKTYGAAPKVESTASDAPQIQSVDKSVDAEKEALLAEIKQAAAEEQLAPVEDEDPDARAQAVLGKYKVIMGKKGPMFYREGDNGYKLVSKNDVPEDIKEQLIESATKE